MSILNVKNFPEPLYEKLRERAKQERRSVAQEVIHLVEKSLAQEEPGSILELRGLGKTLWSDVEAGEHVDKERRSWS